MTVYSLLTLNRLGSVFDSFVGNREATKLTRLEHHVKKRLCSISNVDFLVLRIQYLRYVICYVMLC